jgi:fumarate reductase subunit D
VPADAPSYERAHTLASHWIGRPVLLGLIALPLWKGTRHLRSLSVDFGGAARDTAVATLL